MFRTSHQLFLAHDRIERAIVNDIPLVPIVFVVMSIFTGAIFWKRDKIRSRSPMGFGGVLAVILSILSGYGLLFLIGTCSQRVFRRG
jgi:uncharacterized BrkB/YihY/UPF0761 family membrane protein